ncbi:MULTISPECIES: ACP synthase [unclassified Burkholderia]|uniref:ACP synthase n=1 Tax=unclassified Burkholderia TaxID=2613784 RepID=UPI000F55E949|nr:MULTISPECIES: ACP synthase [unclassified Burkholderia]RQR81466.1 ACP synthase [Burkholderia sp. Bp9011]RQR91043.1 ACP synthase [Burkholderia sp. Bp9010]RQS75190.1 ACP synthase [Burkholderia sp. Bp8977]
MKRPDPFKPATTYAEFVAHAEYVHQRRLSDLKKAEKQIRAIESDLRTLYERHKLSINYNDHSMVLIDCATDYGMRAQWGLRIGAGISGEYSDRVVRAFLEMGWVFERARRECGYAAIVMRKPKTQLRILLDGSRGLIESLKTPEVA